MSFIFALLYLITEFLRPQSMYESLAGLPLAQAAIIGIIISFIAERRALRTFNLQNILIVILMFWIFLSYLFSVNNQLAWQPFIDFTKLVVIYFLLINILSNENRLYWCIFILLLIQFKFSQHLVRQLVASGFDVGSGFFAGAGLFANPGDLGTALATFFGISFCMTNVEDLKFLRIFNLKWFFWILTLILPVAIIATNTRGAALGFAVSLLYISYLYRKKFISVFLIAVMIIIYIGLISNIDRFRQTGTEEDVTAQQRIELWLASIKIANEYPLTGAGPNNFVFVNTNFLGSDLELVQHNIFMQVLSELGYPGLFIFLSMILYFFYNQKITRYILREKKLNNPFLYWLSHGLDISMVGFLVSAFFVSVFYYPLFWTLLIISVSLQETVKGSNKI